MARVGPARWLPVGHRPGDDFTQKQAKSITAGVLLFIVVAATAFLLDPSRSAFIHAVDAFSILACVGVLALLHLTGSLRAVFAAFSAISLVLIVVFLTVVGNRGADLILPLVYPLLAVVTIGPSASRIWLGVFVATLLSVWAVEPYLPEVSLAVMQSADNPQGWLFHAPGKRPLDGVSVTTAILGAFLTYGIVYFSWSQLLLARAVVQRQREELAAAYEKSETLLRSILPESVARRLKEAPSQALADDLDDVSLLFADIVGFTTLAAQRPAREVVELLNALFSHFDSLVLARDLEKVKTVGDAYMAASGLDPARGNRLAAMADLALAMHESAREIGAAAGIPLELRIGLHAGPATAGVIGTLKPHFDIWGDTVNLTARLQEAAEPGEALVSEAVRARLDTAFAFGPARAIHARGNGPSIARALCGRKSVEVS